MKHLSKFPTGESGWGVCVTNTKAGVEIAITGPDGGWYPGDWMTPEQAEAIGVGVIQSAQASREKQVTKKSSRKKSTV